MKETRRVRLTKQSIKDALLELLSAMPLSGINVTLLCKAADVNRSTFYAYYTDISGLLAEIEDDILSRIPLNVQPEYVNYNEHFLLDLEVFFSYIKRNEKTFRVLMLQCVEDGFEKKLLSFIYDHYKNSILIKDELLARYCCIYCLNGISGMLKEWIRDGFSLEPEQFADKVFQMSIQATDIE